MKNSCRAVTTYAAALVADKSVPESVVFYLVRLESQRSEVTLQEREPAIMPNMNLQAK